VANGVRLSLGFLGLGLFCIIGQKAEGEEVKSKKGKVKREEGKGKREKEKGRGQGKSKFKMQNAKLRKADVVGMGRQKADLWGRGRRR